MKIPPPSKQWGNPWTGRLFPAELSTFLLAAFWKLPFTGSFHQNQAYVRTNSKDLKVGLKTSLQERFWVFFKYRLCLYTTFQGTNMGCDLM